MSRCVMTMVMLAGMVAFMAFMACASPSKPKEKPHAKVNKPTVQPAIGESDTLQAFYYSHREVSPGQNPRIEVYSLGRYAKGDDLRLYYRLWGERTGWGGRVFLNDDLLQELDKMARDNKLNEMPYTANESRDESRSHWYAAIEYAGGKKVEVVSYEPHEQLRQAVLSIFGKAIESIKQNSGRSGYRKYRYKADGSLSQYIDYDADGTVMGGYDADDPLATF